MLSFIVGDKVLNKKCNDGTIFKMIIMKSSLAIVPTATQTFSHLPLPTLYLLPRTPLSISLQSNICKHMMLRKNLGLLPHTSSVVVFLMRYCWVALLSPTVLSSLANSTDELSLLALKAHLAANSAGILGANWSTTVSYCSWVGVSCDAAGRRVVALDLSDMGLEGTIPPQVGNLSCLVSLDLCNNSFHASIPFEIGKL